MWSLWTSVIVMFLQSTAIVMSLWASAIVMLQHSRVIAIFPWSRAKYCMFPMAKGKNSKRQSQLANWSAWRGFSPAHNCLLGNRFWLQAFAKWGETRVPREIPRTLSRLNPCSCETHWCTAAGTNHSAIRAPLAKNCNCDASIYKNYCNASTLKSYYDAPIFKSY